MKMVFRPANHKPQIVNTYVFRSRIVYGNPDRVLEYNNYSIEPTSTRLVIVHRVDIPNISI